MADFKIPYGADFSPEKIEIEDVLSLASSCEGKTTEKFINEIADKYFKKNCSMANNCKNSMVSYEILEQGGGIALSSFGKELIAMESKVEIYEAMAKRILTYHNGLMLIEAIRIRNQGGKKPTLESIAEILNQMGCERLSKTNKHVPTMKKWLEKANVLNGWNIKENQLERLMGMKNEDVEVLRDLNHMQASFIKALCNTGSDDYQNSIKIRNLATASYNVEFPAKNFSSAIINPLVEKKLIEKKTSKGTHGGNASEVKLVESVKADVLAPVLEQIETVGGKEVIKYFQKSLVELRKEINSSNTHVKGLALEAFAIKMMKIIDLDFIGTRVKGSETGGAEVDVLFDTTRLNYSRWQVQCKNTSKVTTDHVAKEVGLSHMLKTNVIVLLTTGQATLDAKRYAASIMKDMNLCIIFIEEDDINEILSSPTSIVEILNRESNNAKRIKVLDSIENN